MTMVGIIKEWDCAEEEWTHYIGKVKFFFTDNDMLTEGKRRAIFLSVINAKHYTVLGSLAENRLRKKTFEQFCALKERHIRPAPNQIYERFLFNTRDKASTSMNMWPYYEKSRSIATSNKVNEHIQDRLVVKVKEKI